MQMTEEEKRKFMEEWGDTAATGNSDYQEHVDMASVATPEEQALYEQILTPDPTPTVAPGSSEVAVSVATPEEAANAVPYEAPPAPKRKSKVVAGVLGILLGCLGIHKFYLGYTSAGVIMLLVSLLTLGFGAIVMGIIGLVEGILYLTKSDEKFNETYVLNKKAWF